MIGMLEREVFNIEDQAGNELLVVEYDTIVEILGKMLDDISQKQKTVLYRGAFEYNAVSMKEIEDIFENCGLKHENPF